ncbi:hypothetical protein FACS1894216_22260 [Synergistales bacterium]|nr:hypothetical protein FACS1894216_22260 [Synergistales bacterium]
MAGYPNSVQLKNDFVTLPGLRNVRTNAPATPNAQRLRAFTHSV